MDSASKLGTLSLVVMDETITTGRGCSVMM